MGEGRLVREDLGRTPLAGLNGNLFPLVQRAYEDACEACRVAPDLYLYASLTSEGLRKVREGRSIEFTLDPDHRFGIEVLAGDVVPYVQRRALPEAPCYDPLRRMPHAPRYVDGG